MKKIFTIFVLAIASLQTPAFAGTDQETIAGAVIGAALGRAGCHNCNQRTQNIATGVGALAGGLVGNSYGDRQDRREATQRGTWQQPTQTAYVPTNQGGSFSRTVQPTYSNAVASNDGWVTQPEPIVERRVYVQPVVQRQVTRVTRDDNCDEQNYRGNYNPEAARAYCDGRRERERQVREAYAEGLAGR